MVGWGWSDKIPLSSPVTVNDRLCDVHSVSTSSNGTFPPDISKKVLINVDANVLVNFYIIRESKK